MTAANDKNKDMLSFMKYLVGAGVTCVCPDQITLVRENGQTIATVAGIEVTFDDNKRGGMFWQRIKIWATESKSEIEAKVKESTMTEKTPAEQMQADINENAVELKQLYTAWKQAEDKAAKAPHREQLTALMQPMYDRWVKAENLSGFMSSVAKVMGTNRDGVKFLVTTENKDKLAGIDTEEALHEYMSQNGWVIRQGMIYGRETDIKTIVETALDRNDMEGVLNVVGLEASQPKVFKLLRKRLHPDTCVPELKDSVAISILNKQVDYIKSVPKAEAERAWVRTGKMKFEAEVRAKYGRFSDTFIEGMELRAKDHEEGSTFHVKAAEMREARAGYECEIAESMEAAKEKFIEENTVKEYQDVYGWGFTI